MTTTEAPDQKILERVRKLLERAEHPNTPEAEADSCVDKAQALMFEHAISEHQARATGTTKAKAVNYIEKRIYVPNPFPVAKISLLNGVCLTNRCKCLQVNRGGRGKTGIIFGAEDDVEFVEMLYTSLLLQLTRESQAASRDGRSTGARWQNAFHHGFADRVHARLRENQKRAEEEVDTGGVALVLANDLNSAFRKEYPHVGRSTASMGKGDYDGSRHGRAAGDRADLGGRSLGSQRGLGSG